MERLSKNIFIAITCFAVIAILIYGLGSAFTPLVFAFIFAYLLFPVIKKLEKFHISRTISIIIIFNILLIAMFELCFFLIPYLIEETQKFIVSLPRASEIVIAKINSLLAYKDISFQLDKSQIVKFLQEHSKSLSVNTAKSIAVALSDALGSAAQTLIYLLNFLLFPLFFFYIIKDFESISMNLKKFIPEQFKGFFQTLSTHTNRVLSGYIRGQLLFAMIEAVVYSVALSLIQLQFAIVIGVITGLLTIIPYLGFLIGITISLVTAIATASPVLPKVMEVLVVFAVVQVWENFILTPKLVGDKVGLKPLTTILVLIIGGNLAGLWGMLLAIPIAAIIIAMWGEKHKLFEKKSIHKDRE